MRRALLIIILFFPLRFFGQCYSFIIQTTSETCSGCCDGTMSVVGLTGGCGPFYFDWAPGAPIGDLTSSIGGLCPGVTYSVTIYDSGLCCPDSTAYCCLDCPTGLNISSHQISINAITIDNMLIVENLQNTEIIVLYDLSGRKVFTTISLHNSEKINLSLLNKRIYILLVTNKEKNVIFRKKIIW